MDKDEESRYVFQLKEEFDSCDTTGTGYLDKEEITELCHKLSLDAHLPLLLDVLLGPQHYARVNFEEFKEGFVAVLSRSLDLSSREEESSFLESEEVSPKFVKGTKRYGRRSQPDKSVSVLTDRAPLIELEAEQDESTSLGVRSAKLRRSTSLESVESLKSDEDTGNNKVTSGELHDSQQSVQFEAKGQLKLWKPENLGCQKLPSDLCQEVTDGHVRAVWDELGVGAGGSLNRQELSQVCQHIGLKDFQSEELDSLFKTLDKDEDGRVSLTEFQKGLFRHGDLPAPTAASTPVRLNSHYFISQASEDRAVRSTSPSLLSATVGQRLLSRLDDGSGCTSPERVVTLWTEEGICNSREILQTLDFSLEERLSLAELTLALDNELLVSGNGIHQAALISYKDEIQFLQMLAIQASQERDKVKADLDLADRRNLQLVREIDDRHATMESLNESKIKDLEQGFRERLSAWRTEAEHENEVLLLHMERERDKLKVEVDQLKAHETSLQEEVTAAIKECSRLEEENQVLKEKLSETESIISKLKRDLNQLLEDKYDGLDPNSACLLNQEERLSGIIKEYEVRFRELQDKNDELNSELEVLKNSGRRTRLSRDKFSIHAWSTRKTLVIESDSDDPEFSRCSSPQIKKRTEKNALGSLESLAPTVSIETELAMEQLKEKYEQEIQDLKIQLETKVNFYERSIELMKQNMEVERKDIAQSYKVEISELEEQKTFSEQQVKQLRQTVERLEGDVRLKSEVMAWGPEQERRAQREQAELEQNYAREIGNIVHRLTSEKDQLEAELKLKLDKELLLVREEMEQQLSQMKAQLSTAEQNLLHHLHSEQTRLQDQTEQHKKEVSEWEAKVQELQEEVQKVQLISEERLEEIQVQLYNSAALEKKEVESQHQEEIKHLRQCVCMMQAEVDLHSRAEEESVILQRQLEEKLEEMCVQLEDNMVSMKAQDALIHNLTVELHAKELEMGIKNESEQKLLNKVSQLERQLQCEHEKKLSQQKVAKKTEEELHDRLSQLENRMLKDKEREQDLLNDLHQLGQELESIRMESETLQKEKETIQGTCNDLSSALVHLQTQLDKQNNELNQLRDNLKKTHEVLIYRDEALSNSTSELKLVEINKKHFIEEMMSQRLVIKDLQVQFQKLTEEWDHLNRDVQKLQNDLCQEKNTVAQLQTLLRMEKEAKNLLLQENAGYRHLSDQLSAQIMEMEAESNKLLEDQEALRVELQLRDSHVLNLRTELDAKANEMNLLCNEVQQKMSLFRNDIVEDNCLFNQVHLTSLLEDKDQELGLLQEKTDNSTNQLQQALIDAQTEIQHVKEAFEQEKAQMKERLLEMEKLVVALETVMDPASPHRTKLDEVNSENNALKDRLAVLHQDVIRLEEEVSKKNKELGAMECGYIKVREDLARLHEENSKAREEVLELSTRNLCLSNENAKLNSCLQSDQEQVHKLTKMLEQVCQEQDEMAILIKQLRERSSQLEKEKLHLKTTKQDEKNLQETQLRKATDKLQRLTDVESALTNLTLKNQVLHKDKDDLIKDLESKNKKLENLQECVKTLEVKTAELQTQLDMMFKEKSIHIQEMSTQHKLLKESQDKVLELEVRLCELVKEKQQLKLVYKIEEEVTLSSLQEQLRFVQEHNQELLNTVKDIESKLHSKELEVQKLKKKHAELETANHEAEEQVLRANTALSLSRAQHVREVQKLQEISGSSTQAQLTQVYTQLTEQQNKTQQLEQQLCSQVQQARMQLSLQQAHFEKVMENMQEQMDDVETKLKTSRLLLQEKVNQLKEQLLKNTKSDLLLKDLYVENAQLMKALQVTEQRQKSAEKKSFLLEEKVTALNKLLCKIAPISLSA